MLALLGLVARFLSVLGFITASLLLLLAFGVYSVLAYVLHGRGPILNIYIYTQIPGWFLAVLKYYISFKVGN